MSLINFLKRRKKDREEALLKNPKATDRLQRFMGIVGMSAINAELTRTKGRGVDFSKVVQELVVELMVFGVINLDAAEKNLEPGAIASQLSKQHEIQPGDGKEEVLKKLSGLAADMMDVLKELGGGQL